MYNELWMIYLFQLQVDAIYKKRKQYMQQYQE